MHKNDFNNLACRVCGLIEPGPPWGEDSNSPTFDICPCCGVEFGYGDCSQNATKKWREKWISKGANWKYPEEKPETWSLEEQMKNIPVEYR